MRKLLIAALIVSTFGLTGCSMMKYCPVHRALFGTGEDGAAETEALPDPTVGVDPEATRLHT